MKQRSPGTIPLAAAVLMLLFALRYLFDLCRGLSYFPAILIFVSLLGFGVYAFLSAVLFFQRRDILLPIAAGCLCLLDVIRLMVSFQSVWSFLGAILYVLASLTLALWVACEIIPSLGEHHAMAEKLWFIPPILAALGGFMTIAANPFILELFGNLLTILSFVLLALAFLFPEGDLRRTYRIPALPGDCLDDAPDFGPPVDAENPQDTPKADAKKAEEKEDDWDGYCEMLKHVLLTFFTFGIWYLIWIYRTTDYLNRCEDMNSRTPIHQVLLCFVPFYLIYWVYQSCLRLDRMSVGSGIFSDLRIPCLILAFCAPMLPPILMQSKMNELSGRELSPWVRNAPDAKEDPLKALRRYKNMLDSGLITQEDYDAKKMQILGM